MKYENPDKLYRMMIRKGYPREFVEEIVRNMNTDYTAGRMISYLYQAEKPRLEDIADEMIAILSDRKAIVEKKRMEHAQAVMNDIYAKGL